MSRACGVVSSVDRLRIFAGEHGFPLLLIPWGNDDSAPSRVCLGQEDIEYQFKQALGDSIYEPKVKLIYDSTFRFSTSGALPLSLERQLISFS